MYSAIANKLISQLKERIESLFKQFKEGDRRLEKTLAHTVEGLCLQVIAKITRFLMKQFLHREYGIGSLNFTVS